MGNTLNFPIRVVKSRQVAIHASLPGTTNAWMGDGLSIKYILPDEEPIIELPFSSLDSVSRIRDRK